MGTVRLKELRFTGSSTEGSPIGALMPLVGLALAIGPSIWLHAAMAGKTLLVFAFLFCAWLLVPKELRVRRPERVFTRQWLLFPKRLVSFDEVEALRVDGKTLWAVRKDGEPVKLLGTKEPFLPLATAELISSYTDIPLEKSKAATLRALWYEEPAGAQRRPEVSQLDRHPEGVTELRLAYGTFLKFDLGVRPGRRWSGFGLMLASVGGIGAMHLAALHFSMAYLTSTLKTSELWAGAGLIVLTGVSLYTYFKRPNWRSIPVELLITAEGIQYAADGQLRQLLHSQVSRVEANHRRRHGEKLEESAVEILVAKGCSDREGGTILIDRLDRNTADYLASRMHEVARRLTRTVEMEPSRALEA